MENKYRPGDLVTVEYQSKDAVYTVYGIVLNVSSASLKLGHNFFGFKPIDTTLVSKKSIQKIYRTIPVE